MRGKLRSFCIVAGMAAGVGALCVGFQASAAPEYHPITPTMAGTTITLTGNSLTIDQVVQIARYGAKVRLSPEATQRTADTAALLNEAAAEGVSVYLFNRNAGAGRETIRFAGDPLSPENKAKLEQMSLTSYRNGANAGYGPELSDEDMVRAIMVIRANQMTYRAASAGLMQGMLDLLNNDVTPVVKLRGGTGQAQGPATNNVNATLVGAGDAYYHGVRMPAAEALQRAGLKPIQPAGTDGSLGANNADVAGMAALLVADAKRLLDWVDLAYAIDLNGMNSSVTPLFAPVQANRPFKWINWDAARVLDMIKGGYLFNDDKTRIIQDPESMRAGYVRQGSAWEEWADLRDAVTIQMNGSEGNPATKPDWSPKDSWELSTPQAMKYYVKGSAANHNKHGYIFSNANWDPYPLSNRVEAFTIALANMDIAVLLRQERFSSTFFTVVKADDVIHAPDVGGQGFPYNGGWDNHEVWQHIQGLINPVPPEGYSSDPEGVEELDAETLFKVPRAIEAVEESWRLVATDLMVGGRWMDVRKAQDPSRTFGAAPTAALAAFRAVVPLQPDAAAMPKIGPATLAFLKANPAATFYAGPPMPGEAGGKVAGKQARQ